MGRWGKVGGRCGGVGARELSFCIQCCSYLLCLYYSICLYTTGFIEISHGTFSASTSISKSVVAVFLLDNYTHLSLRP